MEVYIRNFDIKAKPPSTLRCQEAGRVAQYRMAKLLGILILSFLFHDNPSGATQERKKLPSAVVVGTVYCDTCFQQAGFTRNTHFIPGASVAVDCRDGVQPEQHFHGEAKTNERGEFKIHLPSSVTKDAQTIQSCSVKLLRSSQPFCAVASSPTSSSPLRLKSRKQGVRIFSAGFFTFKPLNQPNLCNQNPGNLNSVQPLLAPPQLPSLNPILPTPTSPNLGTLLPHRPANTPPGLPQAAQSIFPPILPPIFPSPAPSIGGIPLPPNPFQPPPLFPPNPFLPPSPPSIFPPNPFQQPPSPLLPGIPTIPGLTPPPPSPFFRFPPLIPGFPGTPPPAASSAATP